MNMNPVELIKFVEQYFESERDQLHALAALSDAPPEDYTAHVRLPVQNPLPAFRIGDGNLGSILKGQNHGVPGPIIDKIGSEPLSIGQLLIGETHATR